MKIERESLDNKLTNELENTLQTQRLELKNKALIEKNNNLREKIKEEINKNESLIEKNDLLKKMIKEQKEY